MKRYMVFGYDTYYPCGGMNDFILDYDSIHDAVNNAFDYLKDRDTVNIYDCENISDALRFTKQGIFPTHIKIYSQGNLVFNGELDNVRLAIV
jgi:hypothetical protein